MGGIGQRLDIIRFLFVIIQYCYGLIQISRFVGVSAGMDMSIAIITQLYGIQTRESVLKHAEYTPHIDKNVDPFALQRGAADV